MNIAYKNLSFNLYFPISTLLIVLLLSTFASGFHFNYFKESFYVTENTAIIKKVSNTEKKVVGESKLLYDYSNKPSSPSPASSPSISPSGPMYLNTNTTTNMINTIGTSGLDLTSNTLLQPVQSRLDYLNVQDTNTIFDNSINQQNQSNNMINSQKETIYDKAVNFFTPSTL